MCVCVRACVSNIKQHQNNAYLKNQVVDGNVPPNIHKVRNKLIAYINYRVNGKQILYCPINAHKL